MGSKWAVKGQKGALILLSSFVGYLIGIRKGRAQSQPLRAALHECNQEKLNLMGLVQQDAHERGNDQTD